MCRSAETDALHLCHWYSMWEQYTQDMTTVLNGRSYASSVRRQKRTCKRCGKQQDVEV